MAIEIQGWYGRAILLKAYKGEYIALKGNNPRTVIDKKAYNPKEPETKFDDLAIKVKEINDDEAR